MSDWQILAGADKLPELLRALSIVADRVTNLEKGDASKDNSGKVLYKYTAAEDVFGAVSIWQEGTGLTISTGAMRVVESKVPIQAAAGVADGTLLEQDLIIAHEAGCVVRWGVAQVPLVVTSGMRPADKTLLAASSALGAYQRRNLLNIRRGDDMEGGLIGRNDSPGADREGEILERFRKSLEVLRGIEATEPRRVELFGAVRDAEELFGQLPEALRQQESPALTEAKKPCGGLASRWWQALMAKKPANVTPVDWIPSAQLSGHEEWMAKKMAARLAAGAR